MIISLYDKVSLEAAKAYVRGKLLAIQTGCWDLPHVYHTKTFKRAKRECEVLAIGVDSDRLVRQFKDEDRPFFNEDDRVEIVDGSRFVDIVFLMDSLDDLKQYCDILQPSIILKNQYFVGREAEVRPYVGKAEIRIIHDIEQLSSTTAIYNKIQSLILKNK